MSIDYKELATSILSVAKLDQDDESTISHLEEVLEDFASEIEDQVVNGVFAAIDFGQNAGFLNPPSRLV
jgi:hypothetical protein